MRFLTATAFLAMWITNCPGADVQMACGDFQDMSSLNTDDKVEINCTLIKVWAILC